MDNLDTTDSRIAPLLVSPEDNLSLKAFERGGGAFFTKTDYVEIRQDFTDWSIDGDPATGVVATALGSFRLDAQYIVRLGGRFPVNRVRFYPVTPEGVMKTFRLLAYSPDPTHPSGYSWKTPDAGRLQQPPRRQRRHHHGPGPLEQLGRVCIRGECGHRPFSAFTRPVPAARCELCAFGSGWGRSGLYRVLGVAATGGRPPCGGDLAATGGGETPPFGWMATRFQSISLFEVMCSIRLERVPQPLLPMETGSTMWPTSSIPC